MIPTLSRTAFARRITACMALAMPLLLLFAAGTAQADDNVTTFTLENGLEVVVIEDTRAPVVTHMLWYKVGSADEPRGMSGVAHYLEHLMFMGTETQPKGAFDRIVNANGGTQNAATSYDYTMYFQRVASDRLDLMMELEADRMTNLSLTEAVAMNERDVVIEERKQVVDSEPGQLFRETRMATQYLHHPYGTPIIGWRHEMDRLNREKALAFYRDHYAPNNAILIVAGDADPETVRDLAERYYGPIPANPDIAPRERVQEPPQLAERRVNFSDPRVSQPYISRSYLAPERDSGAQERAAALTMLAEVLGGGQTSVLNRKLQFEQSAAVYTAAFYGGTSLDDTTFGLILVPTPELSLEEAEERLDAAIVAFMDEGVDAAQLERIKFQIRADQVYSADAVESTARRYGRALTAGLTVEDVQAWPDMLQAVTADDIMEAARMVFDRRNAVTGYLMPEAREVTQ